MTPQQRTRLQNGLMLVSFLIAGAGTGFWVRIKMAGGHPPLWLMALVGYGWIFVVFLGLNYAARQFSQARRAPGTPYMPRGVNPRPVPTPKPPLRNPRPTPKPPEKKPVPETDDDFK